MKKWSKKKTLIAGVICFFAVLGMTRVSSAATAFSWAEIDWHPGSIDLSFIGVDGASWERFTITEQNSSIYLYHWVDDEDDSYVYYEDSLDVWGNLRHGLTRPSKDGYLLADVYAYTGEEGEPTSYIADPNDPGYYPLLSDGELYAESMASTQYGEMRGDKEDRPATPVVAESMAERGFTFRAPADGYFSLGIDYELFVSLDRQVFDEQTESYAEAYLHAGLYPLGGGTLHVDGDGDWLYLLELMGEHELSNSGRLALNDIFMQAGDELKVAAWSYTWNFADASQSGANPVPEPATMLLLGTGLFGFAVKRRKIMPGR